MRSALGAATDRAAARAAACPCIPRRPCTQRPCSGHCLRSLTRAFHSDSPCTAGKAGARIAKFRNWTDDHGTCVKNLFLRSQICSRAPGIFAQPKVHLWPVRMHSYQAETRLPCTLEPHVARPRPPSTSQSGHVYRPPKFAIVEFGNAIFSCEDSWGYPS